MHDPMTVIGEMRWPIQITLWHVDPEKDGSDDSCDWFGGRKLTVKQKQTLDRISSHFEHEWNRSKPYERFGWFMPRGSVDGVWRDGEPNYSTHSLVLSMFRIAANEHFGHWSRQAEHFLSRNLFNILHFAENSCDSLCDTIEQKHGARDGKVRDQAHQMASCVYAWIIRKERPWYRHPRWHFWHWKVQVHALQRLRRWLLTRCSVCGRGFRWGEAPVGGWDSPPPRWLECLRGERFLRHQDCDARDYCAKQEKK